MDDVKRPAKNNTLLLVSLIFIGLFLCLRIFYLYFSDAWRFPIEKVQISASYEHISRQKIISIVSPYLEKSYFMIPLAKIKASLEEIAWVDAATVDKLWPNAIKITISEKKIAALFNQKLVAVDGQILPDSTLAARVSLAELTGPEEKKIKVLQIYQKLSKILQAAGLSISSLDLSKNNAWTLQLENGTRVSLGKGDVEQRLRRFCKAYPALVAENNKNPVSVDLRYPRAMAVRWT